MDSDPNRKRHIVIFLFLPSGAKSTPSFSDESNLLFPGRRNVTNVSLYQTLLFDVADYSRVCYVEEDLSSKEIYKNPYGGGQCLHYDV